MKVRPPQPPIAIDLSDARSDPPARKRRKISETKPIAAGRA